MWFLPMDLETITFYCLDHLYFFVLHLERKVRQGCVDHVMTGVFVDGGSLGSCKEGPFCVKMGLSKNQVKM